MIVYPSRARRLLKDHGPEELELVKVIVVDLDSEGKPRKDGNGNPSTSVIYGPVGLKKIDAGVFGDPKDFGLEPVDPVTQAFLPKEPEPEALKLKGKKRG